MVCAPVRSIIPSLKRGDYLSVQGHKSCSISHLSVHPFIHVGPLLFVLKSVLCWFHQMVVLMGVMLSVLVHQWHYAKHQ